MAVLNPLLAGALTGALLGGIGRAVVAGVHLRGINQGAELGLLSAALIGVIIGALAGLTGKPLLGAVIGAVLSALAYLGMYPIVMLFHALGTLTIASIWEVVAVGALSGGLGGAAGRMAAQGESNRKRHGLPR